MKRSNTDESSSNDESDNKPDLPSTPTPTSPKVPQVPKTPKPSNRNIKPAPSATPSPPKRSKKSSPGNQANGDWTPEKRAEFFETIIANGYKSTNLDDLGDKLGMGKKQLVNQLTPGRKGSFREKAIQAVRDAGSR